TRRRARRRTWPGARPLSSGHHRQREAPERAFRTRRSVVPYVGHRGGDAGGAVGALPHPPVPPGALLRRLSWLVGRRATGYRQPAAGARDPLAEGHVGRFPARASDATRPRLGAPPCAAG